MHFRRMLSKSQEAVDIQIAEKILFRIGQILEFTSQQRYQYGLQHVVVVRRVDVKSRRRRHLVPRRSGDGFPREKSAERIVVRRLLIAEIAVQLVAELLSRRRRRRRAGKRRSSAIQIRMGSASPYAAGVDRFARRARQRRRGSRVNGISYKKKQIFKI